MKSSAALLALAICSACAFHAAPSGSALVGPLAVHQRFGVAYTGRVDAELDGTSLADASAARASGGISVVDDDGTPQVRIDTKVLRMRGEDFRRAFGLGEVVGDTDGEAAPSGGLVRTSDLEPWIDSLIEGPGQFDLLTAPSILVLAGHSASTWAARQLSMIRSLALRQASGRFVSAPKAETAEVGFGLDFEVAPPREDGSVGMDVTVRAIDLVGEPVALEGRLAGAPGLVVQVPLVCRQTLRASIDLVEGDSAFLGSLMTPDGDGVLVVFISAVTLD